MSTLVLKYLIIGLSVFFSISNLSAKVKLPAVLGDNMVLQQQSRVKIWGEATAKAKITVKTTWNCKSHMTTVDDKGYWILSVETPVAGGPYDISISDGEEITLKNILIGEVWFCSGQSNMAMSVRGFDWQPVIGANDIIAKAKQKTPIRMFTTDFENGNRVHQFSKQPQKDCKGEWLENTSGNVANISATAYFFAQYLQDALDIPIGIIVSSWGSSVVEAWMSREAITPFSSIDLSILDNNEKITKPNSTPCVLYNAKIAPFTNFAIKGFLWYQGESNRKNADQYAELMPVFVKDIRTKWNIGELPFYFVQIAPYNYEGADSTASVRLREVQLQNMKDIPNSGMVTTMDVGDPICIHPPDKKTVGNRLALWALSKTYGKQGIGYAPPTYESMEKKEDKIYINFNNAQYGIVPIQKELGGFEIAGEDKVFYPAKARVESRTGKLVVYNEDISNPIAVRYGHKNYVKATIFSVYGIPAAPFRTDNW